MNNESPRTARIGVIGSINTDLVTTIDRIPAAGETRAAISFSTGRGGKGANQAVAAARNGARIVFVGAVGDDDSGRDAVAALQADEIDVTHIARRAGVSTGTASIIVEETGENRILIAPGANATLQPADIDRAASSLAGCDLILLQLEIPLATVRHAIGVAAAAGVPVLLNPAPATPDLLADDLGTVRFLVPNETELSILTGVLADTEQHVTDSGTGLLKRGVGAVIVTRGDAGALLIEPAGTRVFPTEPVTPVDTTGAGDAFVGSFAAHWAIHHDVQAAIAHANHYAAITVTRIGAQSSFPSLPAR
jgi:ribokinase